MWELNLKQIDLSLRDNLFAHIDISNFILKKGINILLGENGIGKSVFMRVLAGDTKFIKNYYKNKITLKNHLNPNLSKEYSSISEAIQFNIRALYQDDEMIKDLLIYEHIEIYSNVKNKKQSNKFSGNKANKILNNFLIDSGDSLLFKDIWYKNPIELSMGQKSVAKLIIALYDCFDSDGKLDKDAIRDNIDILLLDEILASVSKERSAKIISILRNLNELNEDMSILIITHDPMEVLRWQPSALIEFISQDNADFRKRTVNIIKKNAEWFCPGIYEPLHPIPIYESVALFLNDYENLLQNKIIIAFCDKMTSEYVDRIHGIKKINILDDCSEMIKKDLTCLKQLDSISTEIKNYKDYMIFVVGGGSLLNAIAFCTSILYRGRCRIVFFPSTITASCDVALGSKTGCNLAKKHHIGTYFNPEAVIIDEQLIKLFINSNITKAKVNLAECFKHAILQDVAFYNKVTSAIINERLNIDDIMNIIKRTTILKSKIMVIDPYEDNFGKLLLYGHSHTRALEEFTDFKLPHDCSLWLGLYTDIAMGMLESPEKLQVMNFLEKNIFNLINTVNIDKYPMFDPKIIMDLYIEDSKGDCYQEDGEWFLPIVKINRIGHFKNNDTLVSTDYENIPLAKIIPFVGNLYDTFLLH